MRDQYLDAWKGAAILSVIIIHCSASTGFFALGSGNWYFGLLLRQVLNFPVPIFFVLAGFFAAKKSHEKTPGRPQVFSSPSGGLTRSGRSGGALKTPLSFYKDRLQYIVPAYLIWTFIYVLIKTPQHLKSWGYLAEDVFAGRGIGVGYFIIVLIQFTLLHPLLIKIQEKRQHVRVMVYTAVLGILLSYGVRLGFPQSAWAQFPYYCLPFIVWCPFYHLGVYFAVQKSTDSVGAFGGTLVGFKQLAALLGFLVFASCLEGIYWAHHGYYSLGISQIKITSYLTSIALAWVVMRRFKGAEQCSHFKPLAWLGTYSFIIYVSHMLFVPVVQSILKRAHFIYDIQPVFVMLSALLTLLFCVVLIKWMNYFLPQNSTRKYFGI
jgi:peptidoglycan/LPS O-acetylase OafA/YrhL